MYCVAETRVVVAFEAISPFSYFELGFIPRSQLLPREVYVIIGIWAKRDDLIIFIPIIVTVTA